MRPSDDAASKTCASCGRCFAWRRKWARCWDQVRYCSERCRRHRPGAVDHRLEDAITSLLEQRAGTVCPSEVARAVRPGDWRDWLEAVRSAGRRLAASDRVVFLQGGRPVDPSHARGVIRLGRGPRFDQAGGR